MTPQKNEGAAVAAIVRIILLLVFIGFVISVLIK